MPILLPIRKKYRANHKRNPTKNRNQNHKRMGKPPRINKTWKLAANSKCKPIQTFFMDKEKFKQEITQAATNQQTN